MNKIFTLLLLCVCFFAAKVGAQSLPAVKTWPFGIVDSADLKLARCDFEKDANAEVLFDKATLIVSNDGPLTMERHTRIKIFNERGEKVANVTMPFYGEHGYENIKIVDAETINLDHDKITYTPVDPKLIYTQKLNKFISAIVFAFPAVKPGSIVELKLQLTTTAPGDIPTWSFQTAIPTRYSEFSTNYYSPYQSNAKINVSEPFVTNSDWIDNKRPGWQGRMHTWALGNLPSFRREPYMGFLEDNLQYIKYHNSHSLGFWNLKSQLYKTEKFGDQLDVDIPVNKKTIDSIGALRNEEAIISTLFNMVKNTMSWNGINSYLTQDGVKKAWQRKTGNSADVNLVLYNLLRKVGMKCYPMVLSTREHGRVDFSDIYLSSFNKTVVYVISNDDDNKTYVLDATNKYNTYNNIPFDLLNLDAVYIDEFTLTALQKALVTNSHSLQTVYINAVIKPEGSLEGTTSIASYTYNKAQQLRIYDLIGKEKYIDSLKKGYINLKINSFEQENADNDTLPLIQNINFKLDLDGSDENYLYLNPNIFTALKQNPFVSEKRFSDIDMIYCNNYKIAANYKLPPGYTVYVLPKSATLITPDSSITFKRLLAQDADYVQVNFSIVFKRSSYSRSEYPGLRDFYKKMYDMLNEQVVLKKRQ